MTKAIFLDRDGTLNEDSGFTHRLEDYSLLPGVVEALSLLKKDFIFFIVTNQSGVGRGLFGMKEVDRFNSHLVGDLRCRGIDIKEVYVCPHHPDEGCSCRKPGQKFIQQAKKKYSLDINQCYVIGDHESDVMLGKEAGAKTVLLLTGHGMKHLDGLKEKPDHIALSILDAAKWVMGGEK